MSEQETPTVGPTGNDKIHTQEDMNRVVAKEKHALNTKYADYDVIKEKSDSIPGLTKQIADLTADNSTQGEALNTLLNGMIEGIAEDKQGLIPAEYSTLQKIEYINKNKSTFQTTQTVATETTTTSTENKPVAQTPEKENMQKKQETDFGGYPTIEEYGSGNPKAYLIDDKAGKFDHLK